MNSNAGKRVLVTGGTGFTGSHLVRRLIDEHYEVIVLDNQKGLFHDELERYGAHIVIGSVTDKGLVDDLVKGCQIVHHLAAAFREVSLAKEIYWNVNVNGTRNLLEAADQHGAEKFVYCSTCGVHGSVKHPPAPESAPIAPADYYQFTKWEGERVAHEFIARGVNVTILRPAAIYGPGDPERWLMLFRRAASGTFLMFGDGKVTYHPVYIDNLIDAFILAQNVPASAGQTYLIGDAHYYCLNDLVKAIGSALGGEPRIIHLPFTPLWIAAATTELICRPFHISPPLFRRRVDWFRQNRAFDITKAQRELGYDPQVDLRTGLTRTGQWYRERNYL